MDYGHLSFSILMPLLMGVPIYIGARRVLIPKGLSPSRAVAIALMVGLALDACAVVVFFLAGRALGYSMSALVSILDPAAAAESETSITLEWFTLVAYFLFPANLVLLAILGCYLRGSPADSIFDRFLRPPKK